MLKKISIAIVVLIMSSIVWAQGIKADLETYAEQMEQFQDLVTNPTLESLLERISQDESEAFYELVDYLQGDYLKSLEEYIKEIIKIKPTTVKVKFLHTEFIESYDALYRALLSASRINKDALRAVENDLDAEVPDEYNDFIFGINLFSIKMNTYSALNRELSFLAQFE